MDDIRSMALYLTCLLVIIIAHLTVVQGHACVFKKRADPSRGGELRWSLPLSELCYCQAVVAPQSLSTCPRNDDFKEGDLWFVDDLRLLYQLTLRRNWQKEILDGLLQRTEYCADECTTNVHNCDINAVCYDISGGFTCVCKTGYEGDGVTCTDINECTTDTDNCHNNAECTNHIGRFSCDCNDGYSGDGVSCDDINECTTNIDNCHGSAECSNHIGSYKCTCNYGYSGDGETCEDINECTTNTDNCHDNAECSNHIGSFKCTCSNGYSGDGVLCEDINECTTNTDNCHDDAECTNIIGSFSCACNDGYSGDGVLCEDINECATNTSNCHENAECSNIIGSFSCACNNGYSGDGVLCEDINECATNTSYCHENAKCTNIIGSFSCACNNGYSGDGVLCEDINECATNTDNCHDNAECSNHIGSFKCTCSNGYSGDGVLCEDINECTTNTDNCHDDAECTNIIGSFSCACIDGYSGDGVLCEDINECTANTSNCHENAECSNIIGSFNCICNDGYYGKWEIVHCPGIGDWKLFGGFVYCFVDNAEVTYTQAETGCAEIEAELASIHSQEEQDFIGSQTEHNGKGGVWWGFWIGLDDRTGSLEWTDGTPVNYTNWFPGEPSSSAQDCTVVVQQKSDKWDDNYCSTTQLPYVCKKQEELCEDINECATNTSNCHENAVCTNIIGSFSCACSNGYSGDGLLCEDINECATHTNNCHENAECTNIIGSFCCACDDGFSGDGVLCDDINECATNTSNCHEHAECSNNIGSFNCTCNDGYYGDGVSCEVSCPGTNDWKPFGGYMYCFVDDAEVTFTQAETRCAEIGAELASIHSQEEQDFIGSNTEHSGVDNVWWGFWIGLDDRTGSLEWTDGTPVNYTNWMPGEPSSSAQDCTAVVQQQSNKWDDKGCSTNRLPYVCKKLQ